MEGGLEGKSKVRPDPSSALAIAEPATPQKGGNLSLKPDRSRIAFGMGESVQAIYVVIAGFYLNVYLLEVACLSPGQVGAIQLIQGCFDAFNDPFIGTMSDKTHTRWGRRRPWVMFSAVPIGLAYWGLWTSPGDSTSNTTRFVYYLAMYMGVSAGITCVQVQVGSLVPELTDDYDERTILSAYRLALGNLIALVGVIIHGQIVTHYDEKGESKEGYGIAGAIMGCMLTGNALFFAFNIREKYDPNAPREPPPPFFQGLKVIYNNTAFLCVVGIYLAGPSGLVLLQTNLLLFCKYVLEDEEMLNVIVVIVQGCALLAIPLWIYASSKLGKKKTYYIGGSIIMVALCFLYCVTSETKWLVWPLCVIIGVAVGVVYLIPYSMLPDVIEADELATGQRREGIYFGFFTIFLKLSVTLAIVLTNVALAAAGYVKPESTCGVVGELVDDQPQKVKDILRLMVSFFPSCLFSIAIFCAWKYPITREVMEAQVQQVKVKRASLTSSQASMGVPQGEVPSQVGPSQVATSIPLDEAGESPNLNSQGGLHTVGSL